MKKILVIDDDQFIRITVKKILETVESYQVILATDGAGGLSIARNELPDLILLDIMLPDIDGFEVLRELKDTTATSLIPVIMVSAKTDQEAVKEAIYEFDANYIAKPFEADVLINTVEHVLSCQE